MRAWISEAIGCVAGIDLGWGGEGVITATMGRCYFRGFTPFRGQNLLDLVLGCKGGGHVYG